MYQEFSRQQLLLRASIILFSVSIRVAFGANQILSAYSVNKPGFDVGGGVAFGAWGHGKIFAEAKWDHVFLMTGFHIDYLPGCRSGSAGNALLRKGVVTLPVVSPEGRHVAGNGKIDFTW